MPYEETWEENGLCWKFLGDVSGDQILRALLKRDMDCRFRGMQYMVIDFADIDEYRMSTEETLKVAEYDSALDGLAPDLRIAIVTTRDDVFEITKLYSEYTTDTSWEVKIFSELQLAKNWVSETSPAPKTS